jgi:hypothetical protein
MSGQENNGGGNGRVTLNRGVTATNIGTHLAKGNYGWAAISAGVTLVLSPETYKAAAKLTKAAAQVSKHLPAIGGAITLGFVAYEVGTALAQGKKGKAAAALAAGTAEVIVNASGAGMFGASDLARQAVVEGVSAVAGKEYRPNDAYLVAVTKRTADVGSKFVAGLGEKHPHHVAKHDPPRTPPQGKRRASAPTMG